MPFPPELFGLGLFLLVAFGGLLALALFAFWLWMLIDCARAPDHPAAPNQRLIWILILVFTGWIGALIYFFVERRPRGYAPPQPPPPPPPLR